MRKLIGMLSMAVSLVTSWAAGPVPDFKLVDVNPNSVRLNALVSPRDYSLQISAYYFGQAH